MTELVLASGNAHKLQEIEALLSPDWRVISCGDLGIKEEIPETADTLQGNALLKARYIHQRIGGWVLADDSGLEVEALDGRPGVYSARYAGPGCTALDNCQKLLRELQGLSRREAVFRTVLCLLGGEAPMYFEGRINGHISEEMLGNNGFGYDPLFIPAGLDQTFAQMDPAEKNKISHRALALVRLKQYALKAHRS